MGNEQQQHYGGLTSKHSKEVLHRHLQGEHILLTVYMYVLYTKTAYTTLTSPLIDLIGQQL